MAAAVLFADVSGFTPLTEALGQKGSEGPEELTRLLNRYFSWMIAFIEAEGGEVVKFGGDALTVVFPAVDEPLGPATRRAVQAAETMRTSMDEFGILESSVGLVSLKMKFGVGAGEVLTSQVGGIFDRWEYIIAGDALRQATQAENRAGQGEIVLSPEAQAVVIPQALPPRPLLAPDWERVQNPNQVQHLLRYYIPGPVRSWLAGELHDWLATLRPMSVMFASIKGLDYSQPNTVDTLQNFLRRMQEVIYHYWGTLTRLTVDDKGTVLLILFGAPPHSHEDDSERALRCALDLQALARENRQQLAIGVTAGRVFAGPVGSNTRREYTVMGDAVNLAARLMVSAGAGRICCNYEAYRNTQAKIAFESLPPIEVKGKVGLIPIYQPTQPHRPAQPAAAHRAREKEPFIGRHAEKAQLVANLNQTVAGSPRIVIVEGEAGIGKSRLVAELVTEARQRKLTVMPGLGVSIEQETPYHVWHNLLAAYFGLENVDTQTRQQQIQTYIRTEIPDMQALLPLLNSVLSLNVPENEVTQPLTPAERQEKLVDLLLALLKTCSKKGPLVLILEDIHWFDPLSWELTVQVAVAAIRNRVPLLLVLVMRPLENVTMRTEAVLLAALDETEHIRLDSLPPDETLTLAVQRLGLTANELPEAVAELVRSRAGGNPFFAEELFYTLHDNGFITFKAVGDQLRCLISDDLDRAAQTLPATIQSTVLSRLDQLSPEKQLMLRVAAVIGHTFAYNTLYNALRQHLDIKEQLLKDHLNDLIYLELIRPEANGPNPTYAFKHIIIREVTYQSLPFNRRRQLHRTVAKWYEDTYGPQRNGRTPALKSEIEQNLSLPPTGPLSSQSLAPYYALLVYHWHQAQDETREQHYASLIAQQAVEQFANAEALGYINRALDLTPEDNLAEQYNLVLARETVYNRLGERDGQRQDLDTLAQLVDQLSEPSHKITLALRRANYAKAISNYPAALSAAQEAVSLAQQAQDPTGQGRGYIAWGNVLLRQANYSEAQQKFEQALALAQSSQNQHLEAKSLRYLSTLYWLRGRYQTAQQKSEQALSLCRKLNNRPLQAATLNMLGLVHFYLGDYPAARNYYEQAISIFYAIGHRRDESKTFYNIGLIHLNLGHYEAARDYFEQTLDIQREIEDQEGTAQALSSLGITYCTLGDYNAARSYLGHSLEIRKEIGSQLGEADSFSKLGLIYHNLGDYNTTKRYCELALGIQKKTGHQESQSYSLTYLGHALSGLDQPQAAAQAYRQALALREAMGQTAPTIDIKAGLAQVEIAQNNPSQALTLVEEILTWIEANGTAGIDNPLWVYLTAYKILCATNNLKRAQTVLESGHAILMARANRISNPKLRRKFLENVKTHQDIISLHTTGKTAPPETGRPKRGGRQSKPLK